MPDETIRCCWTAFFNDNDLKRISNNQQDVYIPTTFQGYLIATNKKLIFVEMKGIFSKQYLTKDSTNWEDIQGVSIGGFFPKNVTIIKQSQGTQHEHAFSSIQREDKKYEEVYNFKNLLEYYIQDRFLEIEREKQKSRIQYVLDFSFLKAEMAKGGITLTTVKCPSCGANVDLPETGNSFQCKYCSSMIHAHDIFSKMKGFIEGL